MKFNGAIYDRMYKSKAYGEEVERVLPYLFGKSILDVGGGTGNHSILLKNKGYEPVVLDISESMLKSASEKGLPVLHGDIQSYNFSKKYDSVIALFHVLNFCKDLPRPLLNIGRALNRGGMLVFEMWDPSFKRKGFAWLFDGIFSRLSYKKWIGEEVYITFLFPFLLRIEYNHLYCPSAEQIGDSLQRAGFTVERCESDGISNFFAARKV